MSQPPHRPIRTRAHTAALLALLAAPPAPSQTLDRAGPFQRFLAQLDGLAEPAAVAVAPAGNIFIADTLHHTVRSFDPQGNPRDDWKLDLDAAGGLLAPHGLAVAPDASLWVSDTGRHQLKHFDPDGRFLQAVGAHGAGDGQLNLPHGIAADSRRLFVADTGNDRIVIFSTDGRHVRTLGRFGRAPGQFNRPHDVALDPQGALYVADTSNHRIQKFDPDGQPLGAWGEWGYQSGFFDRPTGLDFQNGRLFVADSGNHRLQLFDPAGRHLAEWGVHTLRPHEGRGRIHYPSDVAASPDLSRVVVAEAFEDRAQLFSPDPTLGQPLSPVPPEQIGAPHFGRHVAADGRFIAIPEPDAHTVKVYDAQAPGFEPINVTNVGRFGIRPAECNQPAAAALDARRSLLYVADTGNRRLLVFRLGLPPPGELAFDPFMARLVACLDFAARPLDVPGLGPRIIEPDALKLDRDGNLYVIDSWSACLLRLNPRFEVTAVWGGDGETPGRFRWPTDLAVASDGTLFLADAWNRRVQALDPGGTPVRIWTGGDDPLLSPFGILCLPDGSILVSDAAAHRLRRFSPDGLPLDSWGQPGLGPRQFFKPAGVTLDPLGRLLVVDYGNHRAQILSRAGDFIWAFGARLYVVPAQMSTAARTPTPPASQPFDHMIKSSGGDFFVQFRTQPPEIPLNQPFTIYARLLPAFAGDTLADAALAIDAEMPQHGHGLVQSPAVRRLDDGSFEARGVLLHMAGRWELYFDVTRGPVTQRAQLEVNLD